MRIALLFPNNIFTSPYLKYYIDIIEDQGMQYDLLIWDRAGVKENKGIAYRPHRKRSSVISKVLDFFGFRKFLIKQLARGDYDRLIVFSGQLGIIMKGYLVKNYSDKYLLDIRDFSKPMKFFKGRFAKLIENSFYTSISSDGFREWLPKSDNYVVSHNVDINLIDDCLQKSNKDKSFFDKEWIQVDTIGQIKDFESDSLFVNQLKNNDRFQMNFIGFGNTLGALKNFVKEKDITNVTFHGPYKKEEEKELLSDTDFINILISRNETNKGSTLLSNRLYLSALLYIPCIVNAHTEQSRIIEKYKFGIIVDDYSELPDKLVEYKTNFERERFIENCIAFLKDVKKEYNIFEQKTINFISQ